MSQGMDFFFKVGNIYRECVAIVQVLQDFAVTGQKQAYTFGVVAFWNKQ